ncbi:hypothetical protein [Paenibacillus periandrae]|uniref:hypothetical protein n=1 Tax=Paenibacillus periandrae TaxID=1761741 RepID=UPI001F0975EF|nr:hypothetical protein [Paenibacillus periandrae]
MSEDIGKVFSDDSKSKKRAANGAFARVKGRRRGMVTAYSFMSKKQQMEYTQCENKPSYNIYETVISIEQLKHLPIDVRLRCWSEWQERFFLEDIFNAWSVGTIDELNFVLNEMDIPMIETDDDESCMDTSHSNEQSGRTVIEQEEESWLSLSDLVADDANVLYFQIKGLMESWELVAELNRILKEINLSQRKYHVEVTINEDRVYPTSNLWERD